MRSARATFLLHVFCVCVVAAGGAGCHKPSTEAAPPYAVQIAQGLDSIDPASRERALQQWDALPREHEQGTRLWVHRHASDRAWLAGASKLDEDVLYRGSFDDTRILAERWLRLASRDREWYAKNGFSESTMHAHEAAGLADWGRAFPASVAAAVAAALGEGRIGEEFREEAIAFLLAVGGPRVAAALDSGIELGDGDREAARDAGLLDPEPRPGDTEPPDETDAALDWIFGAAERPLSRLDAATRARVVAELRDIALDPDWVEGTARLLAEAIVSEGLPMWIKVLDGVVPDRQTELLHALPRGLALRWIEQRPALGARLPEAERDLLTSAAPPASPSTPAPADSPWLSLDRLVLLVRWRASESLPELRGICAHWSRSDLPLLAEAALTADNKDLRAFFNHAPIGRIEDMLSMEDFGVFLSPGVADALLELMQRGERSSAGCQAAFAEVFRAQVDTASESASPAVLLDKAARWARWWNREGRTWNWDAWSGRYWPPR